MLGSEWLKTRKRMIKLYQIVLNLSLVILSLILIYCLFKELFYILNDASRGNLDVHEIFGKVLIFFLYFGFISMIVKYFSENYHFPLRYLLYIGITATIRYVIVNNGDTMRDLWSAGVIFVLIISYQLLPPPETNKD
ncbi:phosphate-starvation-inducible protein PsiE [Neobacillus massiliamazoniensis]|uniref:Protein PsiE n=1 Tax=Neobacillus massiliamazoniensis TaxID=1499688 RepID=A0A0U1NQV8_9BACI|nr:phosphate-starvation-inducible PsiE family protein [Neobacillus massiliamazoniensis]CRK80414.1 phosphate starvation-induced protein E [Neobacillus massiliamazoniensis]